MDLCSFSKAKLIAVDHPSYQLLYGCKLEDWWPQNSYIKTFTYGRDLAAPAQIVDFMAKEEWVVPELKKRNEADEACLLSKNKQTY